MQKPKQMRIWICWNYRYMKERMTKVPCSAFGTETGTDESHSNTWVSYEEAADARKRRNYGGIGFVIPKERQDKTLLDKLYTERRGIVFKAVKALQTVIRNGYRFTSLRASRWRVKCIWRKITRS